jgi:hypothetical protein
MDELSEDAKLRLKQYLEAEQKFEDTYERGPVAELLARTPGGEYVIPAAEVPQKLFHDGPTSGDDIRALIQAGGNIEVVENYAAFMLRTSEVFKPDGITIVDLKSLDAWTAKYSMALSALPNFSVKLQKVREEQKKLAQLIIAQRKNLRDEFLSVPVRLFIENDAMTAIEKIFDLPDTTAAFQDLTVKLGRIKEGSIEGLKKGVADYIIQKIGVTNDRRLPYLRFFDAQKEALRVLFGEEGIRKFDRIAADLRRLPSDESEKTLEVIGEKHEAVGRSELKIARWYRIGGIISAGILFVGFYMYSIVHYGFLLGAGLGWIPSAIAACVLAIFWPLIVGVAAAALVFVIMMILR